MKTSVVQKQVLYYINDNTFDGYFMYNIIEQSLKLCLKESPGDDWSNPNLTVLQMCIVYFLEWNNFERHVDSL